MSTVKRTNGEMASLLYHGCDRHKGEWNVCEVPICQLVREEAEALRSVTELERLDRPGNRADGVRPSPVRVFDDGGMDI